MHNIERRAVLRGAAAAALGVGASAAMTGQASASPAESTGARGGHGHHVPRGGISIQLYTLRTLLAQDLEGTLEALADIGYRKVELAGLHGRTAAQFRAILDGLGLHASSSHVGIDGANWPAELENANTLGQRFIVHPFAQFGTAGEWHAFADRLNAAGAAAKEAGLRFGYHNHAHEFTPLPTGEVPFDIIAGTDPKLVHLEIDLFWAVTGNQDPVRLLAEHGRRVMQFHVKDRGPDGSMVDPGTGTIDFPRIFAHARKAGVQEYIVEHDEPPSPLDTARVGYKYLRTVRVPRC